MRIIQIILESLIRACLKLIPNVGPFLEQIIFGTKEDIQNARIKESLEVIQNKLSTHFDRGSVLWFEHAQPEWQNCMNQFYGHRIRDYKGPKLQYHAIKDIKRP